MSENNSVKIYSAHLNMYICISEGFVQSKSGDNETMLIPMTFLIPLFIPDILTKSEFLQDDFETILVL